MDFNRWLNETIVSFMNYVESDLIRLLLNTKIHNIPKGSSLKSTLETIINKGVRQEDDKSVLITFLIEHLTAISKRLKNFKHLNLAYQSLVKLFKEEEQG